MLGFNKGNGMPKKEMRGRVSGPSKWAAIS